MLANNGRISAGKKSKQIKNHNFLITDKVHQEDLEICYKPTGEILSNYQSKPQKGNILRTIRAYLMNCPIDYNDEKERRKTHPLFLPNIDSGTKGEELKKNLV